MNPPLHIKPDESFFKQQYHLGRSNKKKALVLWITVSLDLFIKWCLNCSRWASSAETQIVIADLLVPHHGDGADFRAGSDLVLAKEFWLNSRCVMSHVYDAKLEGCMNIQPQLNRGLSVQCFSVCFPSNRSFGARIYRTKAVISCPKITVTIHRRSGRVL